MAVVATAERGLIVYQLENQPSEFRRIDSPLKHQVNLPTFCQGELKFSYLKPLSKLVFSPAAPLCGHI